MANLANGRKSVADLIISHPQLLTSLHTCMSDAKADVRQPAVSCVLELIRSKPERRLEFQSIISTLTHMCHGGPSIGSPGGRMSVIEDDSVVIDLARRAVELFDHGIDEIQ